MSEQPAVAHHGVALLRVRDASVMDALLAKAEVRALVWCRLDGHRALVDPERLGVLRRLLRQEGLGVRGQTSAEWLDGKEGAS